MRGPLVAIGRIRGPHGRDGALVVLPLTDVEANFREGMEVFLAGGSPAWARIGRVLDRSKRGIVVEISGVSSREQALDLRGHVVQVPRYTLAEPPESTYYVFDLIGLRVQTVDGDVLGTVLDVLPGPANDVLAVAGDDGGECLLPMIRDVVQSVSLRDRIITVRPWEGMVE